MKTPHICENCHQSRGLINNTFECICNRCESILYIEDANLVVYETTCKPSA